MRCAYMLLAFAVVSTSASSAITPAVEYYHAGFDHYFLTASPTEIAILDAGDSIKGWVRTGKSFDVDDAPAKDKSPVCRFFSTNFSPRSSHFYTANAAECTTVKKNADWKFEGDAFYVSRSSRDCEYGAKVYRFYNNGKDGAPNHRYTADSTVREEMLNRGWTLEGVTFCTSLLANPLVRIQRLVGNWKIQVVTDTAVFNHSLSITGLTANPVSSTSKPWLLVGRGDTTELIPSLNYWDDSYEYFSIYYQDRYSDYTAYILNFVDTDEIAGCYYFSVLRSSLYNACLHFTGIRNK